MQVKPLGTSKIKTKTEKENSVSFNDTVHFLFLFKVPRLQG